MTTETRRTYMRNRGRVKRSSDPEYVAKKNERARKHRPYKKALHGSLTYLIRDEHGRGKIGHTTNLAVRLTLLQCGNADRLVVVGVLPGKQELLLHDEFSAQRIRGEWFTLTQELEEKFPEQLT